LELYKETGSSCPELFQGLHDLPEALQSSMEKYETPNVAVREHNCPRNHEGSLKGMEVKVALECVNRVWSSSEIRAFIEIICVDDDASTRAYLSHSFADLDAMMGSMVGSGKAPMMSALDELMVFSSAGQEGSAEVDKKRRSVVSDDEVRN
jgi:hypothetical protein